ncbi:MAG TPA: DUF1839 family protein [Solirubrobacteraceae bacterium]|nr:DUF1839 family protein [Solirubrobacteraceae bacterium]
MTVVTAGLVSLLGLDPASYRPHMLHAPDRTYAETNCYADIVVELLHACGMEPLAAMGCAVRVDFEGDQWTFLKPLPADLERLFGIDVHELQPYRPLPEQALEQILDGRTLIVELDAWYLPDTAATSYRREHVKTSVAIEGIDPAAERLRYFHAGGLYELRDEDYRGVFHLSGSVPAEVLPPYTELVRFDLGAPLTGEALLDAARASLAEHLRRRPRDNPFGRFAVQLEAVLPTLFGRDPAAFHAYAFATVRMAGSAFQAASAHARWLLGGDADAICRPLEEIVEGCKALSFKLARRRHFEPQPTTDALAAAWDEAMGSFDAILG